MGKADTLSLSKIRRALNHRLTLLLIPHARFPALHMQFSFAFLLFLGGSWTALTVTAGYLAGRQADYWITKADNRLLRAKVEYFANEISRSREMLDLARDADKQVRYLLGMSIKRPETPTGMGGPGTADRNLLQHVLNRDVGNLRENEIRRQVTALQEETQKRLISFQEIAWYIANQINLYRSIPSGWPAKGNITSRFGYRISPILLEGDEFHPGVDIADSPGTPVTATADGVVRHAGWQGGYGRMVLIDHGFGFSTLYGHSSEILVQPNQHIRRGQIITYMGSTGRTTGTHVHYEVWQHGKPVNPTPFLNQAPSQQNIAILKSPIFSALAASQE